MNAVNAVHSMNPIRLLRSTLAALALAFAAGASAWAAPSCPVPAAPFGAKVEMVAPSMRANSMETSIRSMKVAMTVDGVLAHYRELWAPLATAKEPGSVEREAEGWRVISHLRERCLTTVQVKADGSGSYALVAVAMALDPNARGSATSVMDLPIPPGSRILSDASHNDVVRNARTLVAINSSRMTSNIAFYSGELMNRGWVKAMQNTVSTASGPSEVLVLRKGTEELSLVLAPAANGQVTIVANIVDRP